MSENSKCPKCGVPLPTDSPEGLCPRCLVAANLATQTEIPGETGPHGTKIIKPPLPVSDVAKLFPQLEILECLGRGGMGAVYKARQPRLDRIVALKILSPEKQGEPKFAERFEREARALAKLHHPNIVTVYDFGETQGNFYLLMEFVDGLTLRQLFQARKLSPAEALGIVPKICEALQYAHEQGIVHRDIKPENILLDKSGRVKIADFGIAKILGDGARENLTAEQVIGTPHYMSPEQIEKPLTVDHRADIYSLGVVFYEMLTGELPLGKFSPPSKKVQIDVRLDEIVLRALEKEPERRYQNASVLKTEVETVAANPQTSTKPPKALLAFIAMSFACVSGILGIATFCFMPNPPQILIWSILAAALLGLCLGFLSHENPRGKRAIAFGGTNTAIWFTIFLIFTAYDFRSEEKSFYIGQTWLPQGDSIEITSVVRTKDRLMAKGHYNLVSHDSAQLALYITTTNDILVPTDSRQEIQISKGSGDFELVHTRLVPGLPHISMYADHHPFASLYFGTEQEAAEESKAGWITNSSPASAETWSPTFAPDEKPDFQKILNSAKNLMDEGSYEEALQHYLWYFNHSRNDAGQRGVRLSFALSDWIELGRRYPKAKQALIEIRDGDVQKFSEGEGYSELFQEIAGINQYLGDDDATLALFKTIEQRDPQLARQCYFFAENLLVQKGDYETCRKYLGDPQAAFERIRQSWQQMKKFEAQNAARSEEQRKHFQEMAKTNSAFAHLPVFPTPPPFADNHFVEQARQLIEILVATGGQSDAEKIQGEALAVLDDPKLKSAAADAQQKVNLQRGILGTITNLSSGTIQIWPQTNM